MDWLSGLTSTYNPELKLTPEEKQAAISRMLLTAGGNIYQASQGGQPGTGRANLGSALVSGLQSGAQELGQYGQDINLQRKIAFDQKMAELDRKQRALGLSGNEPASVKEFNTLMRLQQENPEQAKMYSTILGINPEWVRQKESERKIGQIEGGKIADFNKTALSFNKATEKNANVINTLEGIKPKIGISTAGFIGTPLSKIPGTSAKDVKANLNTVLANLSFSELQDMRDSSPTGGALGQVTPVELELLSAAKANLQIDQSPEQLLDNINKLEQQIKSSQARINAAYQSDLQKYGTMAMKGINHNINQSNEQPINNNQGGIKFLGFEQ